MLLYVHMRQNIKYNT